MTLSMFKSETAALYKQSGTKTNWVAKILATKLATAWHLEATKIGGQH